MRRQCRRTGVTSDWGHKISSCDWIEEFRSGWEICPIIFKTLCQRREQFYVVVYIVEDQSTEWHITYTGNHTLEIIEFGILIALFCKLECY